MMLWISTYQIERSLTYYVKFLKKYKKEHIRCDPIYVKKKKKKDLPVCVVVFRIGLEGCTNTFKNSYLFKLYDFLKQTIYSETAFVNINNALTFPIQWVHLYSHLTLLLTWHGGQSFVPPWKITLFLETIFPQVFSLPFLNLLSLLMALPLPHLYILGSQGLTFMLGVLALNVYLLSCTGYLQPNQCLVSIDNII